MFADDVVDNDPAPDQGPGSDGLKQFFTALRTGFPDVKVEPSTLVADDDNVAIAYTISGTHQSEFNGVAPTGKSISARGVQTASSSAGAAPTSSGSCSSSKRSSRRQGRETRGGA